MVTTVEIDSRGRVALGKIAKAGTYRATRNDDGSILLEPAQVVTEAELAVLRNAAVTASIQSVVDGQPTTQPYDWKST
ncbi:MAG: hypothetical protein FWF02_06850 [Micrococcales bacterium]|nr:hypothetical protein [Micrococcales bacterium]MCL2667411.1 hypothetical protein [Micrococcales bacterium]